MTRCLINRPGVAWAVPQSPLLLVHLISDPFVQKLQDTVYPKPEELGIKYVHPPPHATCHVSHPTFHMSCVMCHVSFVRFQVSGVRCQMSLFFYKVLELVGVGSVINWAYFVQFLTDLAWPAVQKGTREGHSLNSLNDNCICRTST